MGALSNIRVLDLTRVLAGPYCTMMLADMGAEVIKIEIPGKGDDTRNFGPYKNGSSMYYANVNRNKKGVSLNMKVPEGKALFLEMVKKADMVVENYRPGVMDKLGLGYDVLKEVNPRIIYGAVSGFGCYGRYHKRPGYDIIAQAMGGLMSITGPRGGEPCRAGAALGDVLGGMNLTIGLLAALNARNLTGVGQRVDVSLVDSVIASHETGIQRYLCEHKLPERMGNQYAATYPYDSFHAKDKDFIIGCGPRLVANGRVNVTVDEEDFPADIRIGRAPRSAVGITKDGRYLLAVVDGRQSHSVGLTLTDWARLLVKFGAQDALNLDGGGSSDLVVNGEVQNSPSDGQERLVGDALVLVAK